jgi:hypothetical protein
MPYRHNTLKLCNEGLDFVDSQYYDGCSAARLFIGCLVKGFDVLDSMVSMIPPSMIGAAPSAGVSPGKYLEQVLHTHVDEERLSLARLDSIYRRFHDPLLSMMLGKGLENVVFHSLTDEFAYGVEGNTYDAVKLQAHPVRYWQSLVVDYVLSADTNSLFDDVRKQSEAAAASDRLLPACYGYVAKRLFDRKSYSTLLGMRDSAADKWPEFKVAMWEHFDPILEQLNDKEVLASEHVFSQFYHTNGLARIMRVYVQQGDDPAAERIARKLFRHADDEADILRTLFDAYIDHDRRNRALQVFRQMKEDFNPEDDSYDREASIATRRARRDEAGEERASSLALASLLQET